MLTRSKHWARISLTLVLFGAMVLALFEGFRWT